MAHVYPVFVVLDREYCDSLLELAQAGPVWIVDTPSNRATAHKVWAVDPSRSHLYGITMFKTGDDSSPEDILINELDTIDVHHGTYSADPPYRVIEVIGAVLSERLRTELSQFGFDDFQATTEGFRAANLRNIKRHIW
jgi:hypothetical protein